MQTSTINIKPTITPIFCKFHPNEKIQRVDTNSMEKNPLKCFECIMNQDPKERFEKKNLSSFNSFIEQVTKLYDMVKNFSTLEDSLPPELAECLKGEDASLKKLHKHIETEKEKVDAAFSMITEEFLTLCKNKKHELFSKLDEQYENHRANFKYYQEKLEKYFGSANDISYPTKETIYQKLNSCKTYDESDTYIKTLKDDMLEISMYGTDPETRAKELKIALKEFSSTISKNCTELPETTFSTNEKANEVKEKMNTTFKPLFENILEISQPIDLLSLSGTGRIPSVIVTKLEDVKVIKSWIGSGIVKFNLLYRGSVDGFSASAFHKKTNDYKPTLTIIKSNHNKVFGGYADLPWNSANNYKNTANTWLFSLDAKEKYNQKQGQAHYGMYCYDSYGPTFGGGHDIYIANNCNSGTSSSANFGYSFETKGGMTYSSSQAQNHLAGAYSFKVEEIEVFHLATTS